MRASRRANRSIEKKLIRLLDANVNRASEGLRVVEDTARFVWNDGPFYEGVRSVRHKLNRLFAPYRKELLTEREVQSDTGRKIAEPARDSLANVATANMKRAQEAVRVLEEYSKLIEPRRASGFKVIRYKLYDLERRLIKRLR